MKKFAVLSLLVCSLFGGVASASTPSDELVRIFTKTMKLEQQFDEQFRLSFVMTSTEIVMSFVQNGYPNANQDKLDEVRAFVVKQMDKVADDFLADPAFASQILDTFALSIKQVYSHDDIVALNKFYGSKHGQDLVDKNAVFAKLFASNAMPYTQDFTQAYLESEASREHFEKIGEQIEQIMTK